MTETVLPHVFAAVQVLSVLLIDSGRTVAVRLRGADGGEKAIMLPFVADGNLLRQLLEGLGG